MVHALTSCPETHSKAHYNPTAFASTLLCEILHDSQLLIALLCIGRRERSEILLEPTQKNSEQFTLLSALARKECPVFLSILLELHTGPKHPNMPDPAEVINEID